MILETVQKQKCSQVNDKRYYFSCGIVSLTFSHPNLQKTNQFKWYKKQKIETCFLKEKEILKELEKKAILKNHRLSTLQSIYDQIPQFRDLETNEDVTMTLKT